MTAYARWLEETRGLAFPATRSCGGGRSTTSRASGRRSGSSSTSRPTAPYERVLGSREMPGARVVPRRAAQLRRAHLPRAATTTTSRSVHASELRDAGRADAGASCARRPRGSRAGLRALGVGPRRPRRRLPAEHPRDDRRVPRARVDRRDLVELLARLRRARGRRPLRADRAEGAARGRRLPLRRQGLRPPRRRRRARRRRCRRCERTVVLGYLDARARRRRAAWDELLAPRPTRELAFERGAVRPPAVGALLAPARPACRRRSCRATAGSCSSSSRSCTCTSTRRPDDRVFWFTTTGWMMWNFLVGGAARPARRSCSTTAAPAHPDMDVLWDLAEDARHHLLRHERRATSRACMKAGVEPARRARPVGAAQRRLDRLAAVAGGLRLGLRPARRRHVAVLDQRRHRRLHRVRRRRADAARLRGELQARALGARSRRGTRRAARSIGEVGELVITEPMPSMPLYFWNDPDGARYRESYFDDVPRRLAPRRLDRDHRARHGDHLPAARTRRSTAAACAWARARSTARCSRSTRSSTRSSSTCRRRTATAGCRCSSCCADGAELDDDARRARSRARDPRGLLAAPRARTRSRQVAEVPRTLSGKVLEVPVKRILMGQDPDTAASRDSLANPAALDWFVQLQRDGI